MELLRYKFRGCLLGALVGDCVGVPYEGVTKCKLDDILEYFKCLQSGRLMHKLVHLTSQGKLVYSDDTAMTRSVAKSLIDKRQYDAKDMASRFTKSFFKKPSRGYGQTVQSIFIKWEKGVKDVYQPAREQFEGKGSHGNGAAMRVAPVALFAYHDYDDMISIAKQTSLLTHYSHLGYNGALLQVIAVGQSLHLDPLDSFSIDDFIDMLIEKMTVIETMSSGERSNSEFGTEDQSHSYVMQLGLVRTLAAKDDVDQKEIVDSLGHSIAAHLSVATAIYIFIRAMKPISIFPFENYFERALALAIHIGGDVDTIASMACAIAGAYYGYEAFPKYLLDCCEKKNSTRLIADNLYCCVPKNCR